MRSKLTLILKFGLVIGLFYVLFQRNLISTEAFSVAFGQWQYLGGAFFLFESWTTGYSIETKRREFN